MRFAHEPPDTTPPPPEDGWAAGCGAETGGVDCVGAELCGELGADCGCGCGCGELGADCGCDCGGGELGADCDWGGPEAACGGWDGPCNPSEPGLAAGGSWGTDEAVRAPVADLPEAPVADLPPALATSVAAGDFEASDRPGASAATSAAKPAVSAAVPAMTHRRVRLMRTSAALRASTARDRGSVVLMRCSRPIMTLSSKRESALNKISMRIRGDCPSPLARWHSGVGALAPFSAVELG
jgi:hypothetical protein